LTLDKLGKEEKIWGRVHIARLGKYLLTYEDVTVCRRITQKTAQALALKIFRNSAEDNIFPSCAKTSEGSALLR